MRILTTQYSLSMKSLDIYISGCKGPHCEGCHNPDTWNFNQGDIWGDELKTKISNKIKDFSDLIDNIMIFGGEPLDSSTDDLIDMLSFLDKYNLSVWLFTRYSIDEVPKDIKKYCSYIKCGRYIPSLKTEDNVQYGIPLATSNQKIWKLKCF